MKTYLLLLIFLLSSCASTDARWTLHEDNDYFNPIKNSDRDFSQGIRLARENKDRSGSTSYYVGQNFYTPGRKQLTEYQPDDRPYAGYLYAGSDFKYRTSETVQDVIGLTAGIVGPHSYAEQTQNEVHRFLRQHTAKGWDNQIKDEFGVILTLERQKYFPLFKNFDVLGTLGANLGNVYSQSYTGLLFRVGYNLPDSLVSPGIIYPRLPQVSESQPWSFYLYAGPFGRAVYRNIFLDGNTFRDSASIDKKTYVAEGRIGFAIESSRYRLAYTFVMQTKEYEGQQKNGFGEVTYSWGW